MERKTYLTIALLLTILDAVVVLRYGGAIWTAWSGVVWIRLRLLLLAALSATALADVWAQAGGRTIYRTLNFRPTLLRRWSVLPGESAKCARWPSRSVIRSLSPCSIGRASGQ